VTRRVTPLDDNSNMRDNNNNEREIMINEIWDFYTVRMTFTHWDTGKETTHIASSHRPTLRRVQWDMKEKGFDWTQSEILWLK